MTYPAHRKTHRPQNIASFAVVMSKFKLAVRRSCVMKPQRQYYNDYNYITVMMEVNKVSYLRGRRRAEQVVRVTASLSRLLHRTYAIA